MPMLPWLSSRDGYPCRRYYRWLLLRGGYTLCDDSFSQPKLAYSPRQTLLLTRSIEGPSCRTQGHREAPSPSRRRAREDRQRAPPSGGWTTEAGPCTPGRTLRHTWFVVIAYTQRFDVRRKTIKRTPAAVANTSELVRHCTR